MSAVDRRTFLRNVAIASAAAAGSALVPGEVAALAPRVAADGPDESKEARMSRNAKFVRVRPAMAETCFQLKWNCTTGVQPFGAQVLTRVGRSDKPDSSMKTISRRSVAHFF